MQERSTTTSSANRNEKGFSVFVGEQYIGYLTIREFDPRGNRVIDEATVAKLSKGTTMATLLEKGLVNMKPYEPKAANHIDFDTLLADADDAGDAVAQG